MLVSWTALQQLSKPGAFAGDDVERSQLWSYVPANGAACFAELDVVNARNGEVEILLGITFVYDVLFKFPTP